MRWFAAGGFAVLVAIAGFFYLAWYLRWESESTSGMRYFGLPLAGRRALKRRIRRNSLPILPLVRLLAAANRKRVSMPVFEYGGVYGPPRVSSPEVFERAQRYQPTPQDVFVVTQMRCGTTWMQQVVFEVVTRGRGEFGEQGFGHLYAMSPWIDSAGSVSMEGAPLVGERPTRIVKSHLPIELCPYSAEAKYIYVTRHPVNCFASIVDYNQSLIGPLTPPVQVLADWFCSDRMYWLPWPRHVEGWWKWAQSRDNVLFVHYEEMTKDFAGVLDRIERFLGYTLTAEERQDVTRKSSFRYMKDHEEMFEMAPPTMFSVSGGEYLKSGQQRKHDDVTPAIRSQILDYCRAELKNGDYPAGRYYPDLTAG